MTTADQGGQERMAAAVRDLLQTRLGRGAQAAIVRKTGYSDASISRMVSGKQPFSDDVLYDIADLLDMPWDQFREATGMDLPPPNTSGAQIDLFPVEVIDQRASASVRAGVPVNETVYIAEREMRYDASQYVGIRVSGGCMEPEIMDGDVVVVELGAPFRSGNIVAAEVLHDGTPEVHVKRLRQRGLKWYLVENNGDSIEVEPRGISGVVIKIIRDVPR